MNNMGQIKIVYDNCNIATCKIVRWHEKIKLVFNVREDKIMDMK